MSPLTRDLPIEIVRRCYAEEIRFAAGLKSQALAEAFATVPREHYLGPGPWQISKAGEYVTTEDADPRHLYHDVLVAIDPARRLNNGHPSSLAGWLDTLELDPGDRVFHIGCGVGYYTAIIAHVAGPTGRVTAVEVDPDLARRARKNLAHLENVEVIEADGVQYDPGEVDVVLVNAGVTHPQPLWLDRLTMGGRLLAPMTISRQALSGAGQDGGSTGHMLFVRRLGERYEASFVSPVSIFPSLSGREAAYNGALGQLFRETILGKREDVQSVRRDPHPAGDTCWLHGEGFCLSTLAE